MQRAVSAWSERAKSTRHEAARLELLTSKLRQQQLLQTPRGHVGLPAGDADSGVRTHETRTFEAAATKRLGSSVTTSERRSAGDFRQLANVVNKLSEDVVPGIHARMLTIEDDTRDVTVRVRELETSSV
jgi:hypothetical protein